MVAIDVPLAGWLRVLSRGWVRVLLSARELWCNVKKSVTKITRENEIFFINSEKINIIYTFIQVKALKQKNLIEAVVYVNENQYII